jgi:hypothetical protein
LALDRNNLGGVRYCDHIFGNWRLLAAGFGKQARVSKDRRSILSHTWNYFYDRLVFWHFPGNVSIDGLARWLDD